MPADLPSIEEVVRRVATALERAGIHYAVGGSIASGVYGEPRSTNDIDIAIRARPEELKTLIAELGPDFDVGAESLRDAVARGRSWNIFFTPLMLKIDLFSRGQSAFDDSEFSRRRAVPLTPESAPVQLSSPEDNLLWKLRWFRVRGEVSDQQWRDILGILRISGAVMDRAYLKHWANELGVNDQLKRALAASKGVRQGATFAVFQRG